MEKTKKVLVAYFSATGTTRQAATRLAEVMDADLYEITPEVAYTAADLDWHNRQSRSSVEMRDRASRPAVAGAPVDLSAYDAVFVGFPIWWYTAPTLINTFIERSNLAGCAIIPFATSGGSSIEKSCADLKATYPALDWKPGRLLNSISKGELEAWKKALGY